MKQDAIKIIPTILEKGFLKAEEKIKLVKDLSVWIQIDVIDGFFTKEKTFELELLTRIEGIEANLFDMHLMVKEPINWINKCVFGQACRIIGQVEMMSDRNKFIKAVKDEGVEAGIAFDIDTDIDEKIPGETDVVLLLARKAGFGDYLFEKKIYEKIEKLKKIRKIKGLHFLIGIDGGIRPNLVNELRKAKVDVIYCGKYFLEIKNAIN